jgi:hypothetical protein
MAISFNVRSDVNKLIAKNKELRVELLRAANAAVNDTAKDVREAAIDEIAGRNPGFSKHTLRGYITLRRAKFKLPKNTKSGDWRSNYSGLTAKVTAAGKAPNLIYFVSPSGRAPGAWRGSRGVSAKVLGQSKTFNGSFVVRAKNGRMVVVSRSALAKSRREEMRPKGSHGKWRPKWSKGLYGPPLAQLAGTKRTVDVMDDVARARWPFWWKQRADQVLSAGVRDE